MPPITPVNAWLSWIDARRQYILLVIIIINIILLAAAAAAAATTVVKRHFTTSYTYPNPNPYPITVPTYSKALRTEVHPEQFFHAISISSDVE